MSTPRRSAVRRRRAGALLGVALLLVSIAAIARGAAAGRAGEETVRPGTLLLTASGKPIARIPLARHVRDERVVARSLGRAIAEALPARATARRRRSTITYRYDVEATIRRAVRVPPEGARIGAVRRALSAKVDAPVLRQAMANTCESAALEILLSTVGINADQARLQAALPKSGPLDPDDTGPTRVWGDPDKGYVGRPDGGGTAGGFGVFPGPVRATAKRFGANLDDVSGATPEALYRRLLDGRAALVWIGLTDGPYGEWSSPEGRAIKVNFGEHTVVLHGLSADGRLLVSNPLRGTAEVWDRTQFEQMWERLGRRALIA